MQNTVEENQVRAVQAQRKRPYGVRVFAGLLGIQGMAALISNMVSFVSSYSLNPSLVLSIGFLSLNVSIFLILLSWGLWTFKRWAYWVTLLVELLVLIRGVFIAVLPPSPLESDAGAFSGALLSLMFILYLVASPNVRTAFFQNNRRHLPENERRGISAHLFE